MQLCLVLSSHCFYVYVCVCVCVCVWSVICAVKESINGSRESIARDVISIQLWIEFLLKSLYDKHTRVNNAERVAKT